jgi:hypothetical protein
VESLKVFIAVNKHWADSSPYNTRRSLMLLYDGSRWAHLAVPCKGQISYVSNKSRLH